MERATCGRPNGHITKRHSGRQGSGIGTLSMVGPRSRALKEAKSMRCGAEQCAPKPVDVVVRRRRVLRKTEVLCPPDAMYIVLRMRRPV
eukprot:CAMPEP_0174376594 /NCGR_PEP_ID=MMETSP0811_2-20130205/118670_1 /TAXON_ID=73025 ORGANISM="Eutreptiella gymnastica-like, Strain CCMP1594" /NCGR_SAMPLE_ID=MMETSP0811_2 /ASSEMBLY_ACC=CAM_ASM_000667 /LENGTH=88 /DNA_ID=CAMNT_0015527891 /DNA_START=364 /DNA_END=630 /DNA_ORIENTATION=-